MARDLRSQAKAVIRSRVKIGSDKTTNKTLGKTLHSVRTTNEYARALGLISERLGIKRIKHLTIEMANQYLSERSEALMSQKTLDLERASLEVALGTSLNRAKEKNSKLNDSRHYSKEQVEILKSSLSERNAISVDLAYRAGLRVHEMLTIRRIDEAKKTASRKWTEARFVGMEGVRYLVTGKGGLVREVMIPTELANQLEERRLKEGKTVRDRGVNYLSYYDIGGGNALSSAVTKASQRQFDFSNGAHGLRHSYAQNRLNEIKIATKSGHNVAREILSQELGHFRGSITEVYLR